MNQHRVVLKREEWHKVISDPLTDEQEIRDHMERLKKLVDRLQSMRLDYQELAETARLNIQNARALAYDINTFANSLGIAPIQLSTIESLRKEIADEPGFYRGAQRQAKAVAPVGFLKGGYHMSQRCIVIGASAGGLEPLKKVVSQLPADLPVPVFVVMHVRAAHKSYLPEILSSVGPLPALHPEDNTKTEAGFIYVAPPDHHLLIDRERVAVKRGPKENGFRPSIDALFRSAAYAYGPGAIGVVLSGALNDGTSGLWSIKRLGGIAIVQATEEAEYPSMPRSALEYVEADYEVSSTQIAPLLTQLAQEQAAQAIELGRDTDKDAKRMAKEVQIAAGANVPEKLILELGELSQFTCPECQGALVRITEGGHLRFRCHTGHGFTAGALLEGLMERVGEMVWQATRGFQEASMLLEHIGRHMQENGEAAQAEVFLAKAGELNQQASIFQKIAIDHEMLSEENVGDNNA